MSVTISRTSNKVTVSPDTKTVTITSPGTVGPAGGETLAFKTVAVSGQSDVVAETSTDTLNLAAGSNVTLTTNASTDTVTIAGANTNVQSDWNATSGDAEILNKPTIPSGNQIIDWTASGAGTIHSSNYTSGSGGGSGISNIVEDTSPQLGGSLDVNGNSFTSTSNGNIDIDPNGSGVAVFKGNSTKGSGQFKLNCENNSHGITVKGPPHSAGASYTLTLPNTDGNADQILKTDGSGNLDWTNAGSGEANVKSNWTETDASDDSFIQNKPTIPSGNQIIDWTASGAGTIHASNYTDTNTTYSVQDGQLSQNNFTNTLKTKLDNIEALADVTDATNVNSAGAVMHTDIPDTDTGFLKRTGSETYDIDTSTYLTANQTVTLSGDVTGSGATGITATLANSGVSAATYGSATQVPVFAVDAKGRVTSVTNTSITSTGIDEGTAIALAIAL